jgi:glycosyltransferase involved in cell wall biosynthesis
MLRPAVFLYESECVFRCGSRYHAKLSHFLDFLAELAKQDQDYRLLVACGGKTEAKKDELAPLDLPADVIELPGSAVSRSLGRPWRSIRNAFRTARLVHQAARAGKSVVVAGPISFLFWLSLIVPSQVRFVYFARGDVFETVRRIFEGRAVQRPVLFVLKLFRWRLCRLLRIGRAKVFAYSGILEEYYSKYGADNVHRIAPLISEGFLRRNPRAPVPVNRPLRVLYVGRLSGEKNVMALLEACKIAKLNARPFFLTIVGFGQLESEVKRFIRDSDLSDFIQLAGYLPCGEPLIEQYDKHDLLCLPSFTEGTPAVVVEAFARALPVVATRVGDLPNLFPGLVQFIDGYGASHIEEAIARCGTNRQTISHSGQEGQKQIEAFLISRTAERVDKILKEGLCAVQTS